MRSRLAISLAASLALAGCAVGPNYVAPKIPPGAAIPFVSATPQAASEAPLPAQWWRLYQDPTRAAELIARNDVPTVEFMPETFEALAPGAV